MLSLSDDTPATIFEAFKQSPRYLDDLLNIDNSYIEGIFTQIDPTKLQLNKANSAETKAAFLDLHLSISNGLVSSKIYNIAMILILTLLPSRFWMVTSSCPLLWCLHS